MRSFFRVWRSLSLAAAFAVGTGAGQAQTNEQETITVHVKFESGKTNLSGRRITGTQFDIPAIDAITQSHQVQSVRRLFPEAGKHEAAHRAFGLDRWYEIKFPRGPGMRSLLQDLRGLSYFEKVEECQSYSLIGGDAFEAPSNLPASPNDPLFRQQWNLDNTGQLGGTVGADIRMLDGWLIETGKREVIVAVIDAGIDLGHIDLRDALWKNTDEIPNNNIDDDHNGYVDDYNGYGFGDNTGRIDPHPHGTHVAGIIGAVTNNANGMSGIAGGSGTADGVRLMSLAAFGSFNDGGFEAAMVYAADNGAIISQNSWGGGSTAIEDAIMYFIARAGLDNTNDNFHLNIQTGPIAGGLVVFAAGNNNGPVSYPASFAPVMAVASTDRFDKKSSFSNYGFQIDISAPGSNILSSVPSAYGHYTFASGTSMACPHVSGVAALVASNIGAPGITAAHIRSRIIAGADPIDGLNPAYAGWLGAGRLNAAKALELADNVPPAAITDLSVAIATHDSLTLQWTATGASDYLGRAHEYDLRYSFSPITAANFNGATPVIDPPRPLPSGQTVRYTFPGAVVHQTYYFAIKSSDIFLNVSPLSNVISVRIPGPPVAEFETVSINQTVNAGDTTIRQVRVTNSGEGELVLRNYIDTYSGAPGPGLKAKDPDRKGRLFAINTLRSTIDELNPLNGAVIRSVPLPEPAAGVMDGLAFDGQSFFFAQGTKRKIYKLDGQTGAVLRSIVLGTAGTIDGLGFSGNHLYVHYYYEMNIKEVNFETGEIKRSIPMPFLSSNTGISFGGHRGTLFGLDNNTIHEFSAVDGASISWFSGYGFNGLAYSDIDNVIYTHRDGRITVYDADSKAELRSFTCANASGLAADESQFDWLNAPTAAIRVPAGESRVISLQTNTHGLNAGTYSGVLRSITNDPARRNVSVPLSMTVTNNPSVLSSTARIDYGNLFVGYPVDSLIILRNPGVVPVVVSQIQSSVSDFTISGTISTINPGSYGQISVRANPVGVGTLQGTITIQSNDPDDGLLQIPVTGFAAGPPTLEVTPLSLEVTQDEGTTSAHTLNVTNNGSSDLHWNTQLTYALAAGSGSRTSEPAPPKLQSGEEFEVLASSPVSIGAMAVVPETGVVYAKSATTRAFMRYEPTTNMWLSLADSPEPGGTPAFYLNDKVYVWHYESFTVYDIATNTWSWLSIGITTTGVTADSRYFYFVRNNQHYRYLPDSGTWKQLRSIHYPFSYTSGTLAYANGIIYAKDGNDLTGNGNTRFTRYFVQANAWEDGPEMPGRAWFGSTVDLGSRQFYVVSETGFKVFDVLSETWSEVPVPLFNPSPAIAFVGKDGFSGIYFTEQGGTRFARRNTPPAPPWLSIDIGSGTILPTGNSSVQVILNSRGLNEGAYQGTVEVFSTRPPIRKSVPVTLHVRGAPEIELSRTSFNTGPVYIGMNRGNQVLIRNKGTGPLVVSSITFDQPEFSFSPGPFTIYPGQVKVAYVELEPVTPGPKSATMTMVSNDPDEGVLNMPVIGEGVVPPEIQVPTDTIRTTLYSGAQSIHPVTVTNTGGSQLALQVDGYAGWMSASPFYAEIEPGDSRVVNITVSAGSKPAGYHVGSVEFSHRLDFARYVPIKMQVIPAPQLSIENTQIDFGRRFTSFFYDTTVVVRNSGVQTLQISQIVPGHTSISVLQSAPLTLAPGATVMLTLRFTPTDTATVHSNVTFHTNDPDQPTTILPVSGKPVYPPIGSINLTAISKVMPMDTDSTFTLILRNEGQGDMQWLARSTVFGIAQGWGVSPRGSTPGPGLFLTFVNSQNYIQIRNTTKIYRANPGSSFWELVTQAAPPGTSNAGAVAINNTLYIAYLNNDTTIAAYAIGTNTWSSIPNGLGAGTANLATDGTYLYAAGGGLFRRYDPILQNWTDLPLPEFVLSGLGGLSFHGGKIYAHEGNGFTAFARYDVASQIWESLRPAPAGAVVGSTIDPYRKRYYAYGARGGRHLYEYDIKTNLWNTWLIPVPIDDGGLTFTTPVSNRGVYFIQGNAGDKYYHFDANDSLTWIRLNAFSGEITASGEQTIGVNLNTRGKAVGVFQGIITLYSNDPLFADVDVPVTMNVQYLGPRLFLSNDRVESMTVKPQTRDASFVMTNSGKSDLHWNLAPDLPGWLTANPTSGIVKPDSSRVVNLHFDPLTLPFSNTPYTHNIRILSDARFSPSLNFFVSFLVRPNNAPALMSPFPNLVMKPEDDPVRFDLTTRFHDGENDAVVFLASSADTTVATVSWPDAHTLEVTPLAPGSANITVRATDEYDAQTATSFRVTVRDVISAIEPDAGQFIRAYPNPFQNQLVIDFNNPIAGPIDLILYHPTGAEIANHSEESAPQGQHRATLDTKLLSPGIYLCRVISNGTSLGTVRVVKR